MSATLSIVLPLNSSRILNDLIQFEVMMSKFLLSNNSQLASASKPGIRRRENPREMHSRVDTGEGREREEVRILMLLTVPDGFFKIRR